MASSEPQQQQHRQFSQQKFILLLVILLSFEFTPELNKYERYLENDLRHCTNCFQSQVENCLKFYQQITDTNEPTNLLHNLLNIFLSAKRETHFLQLKQNKTLILAKNFGNAQKITKLLSSNFNGEVLRAEFLNEARLDGLQICPTNGIQRFMQHFQAHHSPQRIWLYMLLNADALLMPALHALEFPVPKTYALCGLTLFQQYAGRALLHFYGADFKLKLQIAKQLLEGVQKLSNGFADFRIYLSDLTVDNIVYNAAEDRLYFVDLNTAYIVDARLLQGSSQHKHTYIECDDCFAFVPQDICSSAKSDLNLFAACQLLHENLKKDHTKGFLYPIPPKINKKYPHLLHLLKDCIEGKQSRFVVTQKLIDIFNTILLDYNF